MPGAQRGSDETGRHTVLRPAVVEVARRLGADRVGLVDVGRPAGFNTHVDRVAVSYGDAGSAGDPTSTVQQTARLVGARSLPGGPFPDVVARVVLDRDPLDVTDPGVVRRLRTGRPPEQHAEIALAAGLPRQRVRGHVVDALPDAVGHVPADALAVVTTTWSLVRLAPAARLRFLDRLTELGRARPVVWVSVEGVGVAPGVPTLGDRPASGHSLVGLTVCTAGDAHAETVGRCWSRGRVLSWLAD